MNSQVDERETVLPNHASKHYEFLSLFKGTVVIFDDEVNRADSAIHQVKNSLEKAGYYVACNVNEPSVESLEALYDVAFVICDYLFDGGGGSAADGDEDLEEDLDAMPFDPVEVRYPGGQIEGGRADRMAHFLHQARDMFVPVFVLTAKEDAGKELMEANPPISDPYIISKSNDLTVEKIDSLLGNWCNQWPALFVYRQWLKGAIGARRRMLADMSKVDDNWAIDLWRLAQKDNDSEYGPSAHEFTEIMNRCFMNRFPYSVVDLTWLKDECDRRYKEEGEISNQFVEKILEGERFVELPLEDAASHFATGDLYRGRKEGEDEYLVNIRAQCDLARDDNPDLFLLKGKPGKYEQLIVPYPVVKDKALHFAHDEKSFDQNEIVGMLEAGRLSRNFSRHIKRLSRPPYLENGAVISRSNQCVVLFVAGEGYIDFDLRSLIVEQEAERNVIEVEEGNTKVRYEKIGRITSPYVTDLQHRFASYTVRTGLTPAPSGYFR